jgi:two-component system, cell cycle response regulator
MIKEQALGILAVWGKDIKENDVPTFMVFANQVAVAIENARLYSQIQRLAINDDLTGLYNRRGFFTLVEQQLRLSARFNHPALLVFLDVDQLKQINDHFGHQEGDQALIDLSEAFRQTFRTSDIMARMGGDEFAVLAVDATQEDAEILIDRLQETLGIITKTQNRPFELSVSIGLAIWLPENPINPDELLAEADKAMYVYKRDHQKQRIK